MLPWTTGGMGRAVDEAYEAGTILVAAAGQIAHSVTYPGKYDRTICAGGVTWQRRIWFDDDAGGDKVDVWAPAHRVLRADPLPPDPASARSPIEGDDPGAFGTSSSSALSGAIGPGTGTSYAAVHVTAAAAMWLRLKGEAIAATYAEPWQRVEAFRLLLRTTASRINGAQPANGSGLLDMRALLAADLPPPDRLVKQPEDEGKWA